MKKYENTLDAIREMSGDDNVKFIGIDESFGFKCQQCGKCCMNRRDIILNPFDIYRGAKYLGITTDEFIMKYTRLDLGGNSKIPMLLLDTTENGYCPLLEFDIKDGGKFKCIIHEAKPGACANHPIGVIRSTDKTTNDSNTKYVKVTQCQNSISDEQHTVREWVQKYIDNEKEVEIAHKIQSLVTNYIDPREYWLTMNSLVAKIKEDCHAEQTNELISYAEKALKDYVTISITIGYSDYDTSKPFISQANEKIKDLDEFYTNISEFYDKIKPLIDSLLDESIDDIE